MSNIPCCLSLRPIQPKKLCDTSSRTKNIWGKANLLIGNWMLPLCSKNCLHPLIVWKSYFMLWSLPQPVSYTIFPLVSVIVIAVIVATMSLDEWLRNLIKFMWPSPELMLLPLQVWLCNGGTLEVSNVGLGGTNCKDKGHMREWAKIYFPWNDSPQAGWLDWIDIGVRGDSGRRRHGRESSDWNPGVCEEIVSWGGRRGWWQRQVDGRNKT